MKHRLHIWEVGVSCREQVLSVPLLAALVDGGFKGKGEGGRPSPMCLLLVRLAAPYCRLYPV